MKVTIGLKMGGCFCFTLAVLVLSSSYALNGIMNIRSALENIAGDSWRSAESSSVLSLNVNQGIGTLLSNLHYQEQISKPELDKIEQHLQRSFSALNQLKNSEYDSSGQALEAKLKRLELLKNAVLGQHSKYVESLSTIDNEINKFNKFMQRLGLFGNYQISTLEDAFQRNQVTSWSGDIEQKWDFVIAIYSARIALGESITTLQTQLQSSMPEQQQENVSISLDELSYTLAEIIDSPLATGQINSGNWKGMSYAEAAAQLEQQHLQATMAVQQNQAEFLTTRDQLLALSVILQNQTSELKTVISEEVKQQTAATVAEAGLLNKTMISSLPIGILLTLVAIWLSYRMVIKPVRNVSTMMAEIASGKGNLSVRLPVYGTDEISELSDNFNRFVTRIAATIGSVSTSVEQLALTSERLKSTSGTTLAAVETQDHECDQAVTAMEEITTTVQDIARNANEAASCTKHAHNSALESCRIVEQNRQATENISSEILTATSVISNLAEESSKVSEIITVIQGIAEQTNLLALNAAIEAARAGEQGRGFAVVADEVRALSHRTHEATKEITKLLDTLLIRAQEAVEVMKIGQNLAVNNVSLSEQVQQLIETVSGEINRINELNLLIATATEEQAQVTLLTRDNLERISSASTQTAAGARSNSNISKDLEQQADQLREVLLQFNT